MTESQKYETKVGSKGEIFLNKGLRQQLGLHPSIPIILHVEGDKLIIERKKVFRDLIQKTPTKYQVSTKELDEIDREINEALES